MNLGGLSTVQDDRGRFATWLAPLTEANSVDSVVNANVVGYLAFQRRNALGERAAAWLAGLVREGNAEGTFHFYPDTRDLYDALARARQRGVPALQDVGATLADRIRARRDPDGGYGDTLHTARALSALHILGAPPEGEALWATVERILRRQRPDGSWPECLFSQGPLPPNPPSVGFGCAMLDTASCIEALVRSIPFPADPEARTAPRTAPSGPDHPGPSRPSPDGNVQATLGFGFGPDPVPASARNAMNTDSLILAATIAILAFLWNLHRDMRSLDRDVRGIAGRVARLEGLRDAITGRNPPRETP